MHGKYHTVVGRDKIQNYILATPLSPCRILGLYPNIVIFIYGSDASVFSPVDDKCA